MPQRSYFHAKVLLLDNNNDIPGLVNLVMESQISPVETFAVLHELLLRMRISSAYVLAMVLGNFGHWNPVVAFAVSVGGLVHNNLIEENRGLRNLRAMTNTMPLSGEQSAILHDQVFVPIITHLLTDALKNSNYERMLRSLEIFKTAVPACQIVADEHHVAANSGEILLDFINNTDHREVKKWSHYLEIYERHFSKFRNKKISLLEFGVDQGGSLQMWKHYFGPQAKIYGVDINPLCAYEEENIRVIIGSQNTHEDLRIAKKSLPPKFDIIIDDGGHFWQQQIFTFEEMFAHLNDGGIFLVEDLHTSYWKMYAGGYPMTFIEYSKKLIDQLHARYSETDSLSVDQYTESIFAMHYYDSVLVIEKRPVGDPVNLCTGTRSF